MEPPVLERLFSLWGSLEPRERLVIVGGVLVALVMLCYTFLWMPVQRDISRLRTSVPEERAQLALMQIQARRVARLRASAVTTHGAGTLLARLERSALERRLRQNITRMEPAGTHAVRLALDEVNFEALLRWLADLQYETGVHTESATITAQANPGIVNARLLLRAPGT